MSLIGSPPRPWRRVRILGSGTYGVVYLAIHAKHDEQIAVKTARLEKAFTLVKENKIYKDFRDCPEIAQLHSSQITVEGQSLHYNLLLEYAPAGTLESLIESAADLRLPEKDVRSYTRTILKALLCMHEKGYVHCDIKPSNILAFPENDQSQGYRLKIADFGSSKEPGEEVRREGLIGKFRGTRYYNPPEVVGFGMVCPVFDIWSLGCTVVEMVGGKSALWPGSESLSAEEFARRLVETRGLTPMIPPLMSDDGKDFLRKCFQREPGNRWTAQMLLGHPYVNELDSNTRSLSSFLEWDDINPDNLSQLMQGCVCDFL